MLVVGGGVALLISAVALTLWFKKSRAEAFEEDAKSEEMVEKYEQYVDSTPAPKRRPRKAQPTNGKVTRA